MQRSKKKIPPLDLETENESEKVARREMEVENDVHKRVLDRLVEAIVTGEPCRTSDDGPRRWEAISVGGFGVLSRQNLWPEALRRIVKLATAHPHAQRRFLDIWCRVAMGRFIHKVGDDDLFYSGLRVLFTPL